ncbi:MAG: hypothetical protein WCF94_01315, partial [bacterium]
MNRTTLKLFLGRTLKVALVLFIVLPYLSSAQILPLNLPTDLIGYNELIAKERDFIRSGMESKVGKPVTREVSWSFYDDTPVISDVQNGWYRLKIRVDSANPNFGYGLHGGKLTLKMGPPLLPMDYRYWWRPSLGDVSGNIGESFPDFGSNYYGNSQISESVSYTVSNYSAGCSTGYCASGDEMIAIPQIGIFNINPLFLTSKVSFEYTGYSYNNDQKLTYILEPIAAPEKNNCAVVAVNGIGENKPADNSSSGVFYTAVKKYLKTKGYNIPVLAEYSVPRDATINIANTVDSVGKVLTKNNEKIIIPAHCAGSAPTWIDAEYIAPSSRIPVPDEGSGVNIFDPVYY